jgi:hypothetical protein
MNRGTIQGWKSFDAVLKDGKLTLKKQKTKKKVEDPPEIILLEEIANVSSEKKGAFSLTMNSGEKFQLRAASDAEKDDWIALLKRP